MRYEMVIPIVTAPPGAVQAWSLACEHAHATPISVTGNVARFTTNDLRSVLDEFFAVFPQPSVEVFVEDWGKSLSFGRVIPMRRSGP